MWAIQPGPAGQRRDLPASNVLAYTNKVKALSPIAYWPLAEPSGSTAIDESGNSRDGAYSNVTLGATGIGDGRTAATFNGTTSLVNVYSASLDAAFNNAEMTIVVWAQVSAAGDWTDATNRSPMAIGADTANNYIRFLKTTTNNQMTNSQVAGGTSKSVTSALSPTAWFHLAITASKSGDALKTYINGAQSGATQTGLGIWAGALGATLCVIGARQTTPNLLWKGNLAHAAVFSSALSAANILALATAP